MTVQAICEMATNALGVMADMMNEAARKICREDEETAHDLLTKAARMRHMAAEMRRMATRIGEIGGERR